MPTEAGSYEVTTCNLVPPSYPISTKEVGESQLVVAISAAAANSLPGRIQPSQETLYVLQPVPSIAPLVDAVGCDPSFISPPLQCIGMDVKQLSHFLRRKHFVHSLVIAHNRLFPVPSSIYSTYSTITRLIRPYNHQNGLIWPENGTGKKVTVSAKVGRKSAVWCIDGDATFELPLQEVKVRGADAPVSVHAWGRVTHQRGWQDSRGGRVHRRRQSIRRVFLKNSTSGLQSARDFTRFHD